MNDPLKYFRVEARELVEQLQSGLLELERGSAPGPAVAKLLRLAHTLKGAARVVKQPEIAKLSHELEELLMPLRGGQQPLRSEQCNAPLALVDAMAALVGALAVPSPSSVAPSTGAAASTSTSAAPATAPSSTERDAARPTDEAPRTERTAIEQVENLTDSLAEVGFQLSSLRQGLPSLARSRSIAEQLVTRLGSRRSDLGSSGIAMLRSLAGELEARLTKLEREASVSLERATRELGQARDRVDQLQLVAAASMFGTLERTTRDAALSLGKLASFEGRGGEVRLEANVLSVVQRALVQAVRNAVAHGIEPSAERSARGKPERGQVVVQVLRRGKRISFVCQDDGRGVDLRQVQREAERLGRVKPSPTRPSDEALVSLLLQGGISTSPTVTEVAGRGVGLDLIREALRDVGGKVELRTSPGAGTTLELSVPASLSALEALIVEVAGESCALPLAAVLRASRIEERELNRTSEGASLAFDGALVPFVPLGWLLGKSERAELPRARWSVVVVRASDGLVALGVDRLLGSEGLVARALPDSAELEATVSGVSLDSDGNPRLLLDPDGLLQAARREQPRSARAASERRVVLVVDDSLTTRMLEQSILESAGYEVELATSGEEGLERAQSRRFDVVLVDVEMPGMDGFEFVRQIRADARLAHTPTVLVTSRASAEDLARGKAVGASGHIAKGEFDQLAFLALIAELSR